MSRNQKLHLARCGTPVHAGSDVALRSAPIGTGGRRRSIRDPLTGLPNAYALDCEPTVPGLARSVLVVVVVVEDASQTADALGSAAGDDLLIEVGRRLTRLSGDGDVVARLQGGRFAILIDDADGRRITARAGRVTGSLRPPVIVGRSAVKLRFGIGTASAAPGNHSVASLVNDASRAVTPAPARRRRAPLGSVRIRGR